MRQIVYLDHASSILAGLANPLVDCRHGLQDLRTSPATRQLHTRVEAGGRAVTCRGRALVYAVYKRVASGSKGVYTVYRPQGIQAGMDQTTPSGQESG